MYLRALVLLLAFTAPAFTQQQPKDIDSILALVRAQRNQFLDSFNDAAVKVDSLTNDLAKANARIKELEDKAKEVKPNE